MIQTEQVTEALKFFIRLGLIYDVDEQGYVIDTKDNSRVTVTDRDDKKELIVYQEQIKDLNAAPVNPFAEGLGSTPSSDWFYLLQRVSLFHRIKEVLETVIKVAIVQKTKKDTVKEKEEQHLPMEFLNLVSIIIEDADEKLLKEFMLISEKMDNLVNVFYNRKLMQTMFRCALFDDPEWRNQPTFTSIRKRSWTLFEKLFLKLFNLNEGTEFSKFTRKPTNDKAAAKLSSMLATIFAVYSEFNIILDQVDSTKVVDLTTYKLHLDNMGEYTDNAKFMVSTSSSIPTKPLSTGVPPSLIPPAANNLPGPINFGPPRNIDVSSPPPGMVVIPGPIRADGTVGEPILVPAQSTSPPPPMQGFYPNTGYSGGFPYGPPGAGGPSPLMAGPPPLGMAGPPPLASLGLNYGGPTPLVAPGVPASFFR